MTMKSMSATLLAAAAALGLVTGTAFADSNRVQADPYGYAFPNFWNPAEQHSDATAAHQGDGASVGIYFTHRGTGIYLFPPNPNW